MQRFGNQERCGTLGEGRVSLQKKHLRLSVGSAKTPWGSTDFILGATGEPLKALDPQMPLGLPGLPGAGLLLSCRRRSMQGSWEQGKVSMRGHSSAAGISLRLLTQWKASSCCRVPVLRLPMVGGEGSQLFF